MTGTSRTSRTVALLALMTMVAGCFSSSRNDEGERCTDRDGCFSGLECVIIDDPDAVCLPIPDERAQRRCAADDECVLSAGQLWPLDADCIDGFCRCEVAADCGFVDDGLTFEPETCRCVPFGRFGDDCLSDGTCEEGLFCDGGTCERE